MTNEEAIKEIQDASDYEVRHGDIEHHHEDIMRRVEAFEKAVNALQKEPCEDAVSRGKVNMLCARYLKTATDDHVAFYEHFCDLPSVTPTRKASEWQQDHAILKAHADGANEVVDRIKEARNEIEGLCKLEFMTKPLEIAVDRDAVLQIIDQLIAEVEG